MMRRRAFLEAGAGLAAAWWAGSGTRARRGGGPADLVLRGATVFDGTGAPPVAADVAIAGDRIVAVGRDVPAGPTADLRGLALAPGFIDIHSHTDLELFAGPRAESKVRQGVTTEVTGQDGGSVGPWTAEQAGETAARYRRAYGVELGFADLPGFFRRLERHRFGVNLASMIGHGSVRRFVVGEGNRPVTPEELDRMRAIVRDAVAAGACGVSSGLEYVPGAFADLDELAALAGVLRGTGLPYATHMRNEDDRLFAAVEEALAVGRRAGVPVHVSHLKAQGRRNWWKAEPVLAMLEAARADGLDVTYDRYPYVAYSTGLANLFPVWARDGGTDAFLARLEDPATAPRIERAVRDKIAQLGDWDAVLVSGTGSDDLAWARGRRLGQLAGARGEEPYALLLYLTRADRNRARMVGFGMSEDNTGRFLAHPLGMVCSDGAALAVQGPLAEGAPHPRSFGTYPRMLGHFCRDRGLMPLETAIHKMTGMPAARLRLPGRGVIAPGAFADLVAFDPDTVADRATFESPHRYPAGIPHVLVNGRFVIRDGEHTGELPGRVVRPEKG